MRAFFSMILMVSASAQAAVTQDIVHTVWNEHGPADKVVEIKNVDVVEFRSSYMGHKSSWRELYVYLWVKPDLGPESVELKTINVTYEDLPEQPNTTRSIYVGTDVDTGYRVYLARLPVATGETARLYASLKHRGRRHYTNEGRPNDFFIVRQR